MEKLIGTFKLMSVDEFFKMIDDEIFNEMIENISETDEKVRSEYK